MFRHLSKGELFKCTDRVFAGRGCRSYGQQVYEGQEKIRNIGILAHIDAGKTTTTERMLFYAGKTRSLGEVHHGTTITDFLAQERERGITICSAAVTFDWLDHRINLLDTPGHIDFTMEVEQSLAAIDGCVVILDGSAGVEVQTVTVWTQAERQELPRLVFVNKMDRKDADFAGSVEDLRLKLNVEPVVMQLPVQGARGLVGIIDVLRLTQLTFEDEGRKCSKQPLTGDILEQVSKRREELIDVVSGHDDVLAERIISSGSMADLDEKLIKRAIRQATLKQRIVPVFLGSAYKNTGVQPLMNGVIDYLPNPGERNRLYDCFENDLAGKVFKVTHDKQRGPLSLVRMFRGRLKKGAKVVSTGGASETVQRIYEPLADEYREIGYVEAGNVAILAGLKNTATGDLLVSSLSSFKSAQKRLRKSNPSAIPIPTDADGEDNEDPSSDMFGLQPRIPDAVYFCSVEPPSQSQQLALETALKQMQREDPSLRVSYDETTMQTVLGGMGELHLEIVKSRLLTEHKIDADLGPLQIAYKETIDDDDSNGGNRLTISVEKEIAGAKQSVSIEMSLVKNSAEVFRIDSSPEATQNMTLVRPKSFLTVKKGAIAALDRGPKVGGQVIDVQLVLHNLRVGRGTADSFLMAAAAQCVQKLLANADCRLLEPIMAIQIIAPADRTSKILSDLGKRRANVLDVNAKGEHNKVLNVLAPLAELAGYSSVLRIISSGGASMSMQPNGYSLMAPGEEDTAIRRTQGLE